MVSHYIILTLTAVIMIYDCQACLGSHNFSQINNTRRLGNEGNFNSASVASNTDQCSSIGSDVMRVRRGSAVDAAIATLACVGVVRLQSSGIAGDSFWTIYKRDTRRVYTIVARSMAPRASNATMFVNRTNLLLEGGLSVAVPGDVMALWKAHQLAGVLPWSTLFDEAIRLAENGFTCEPHLEDAIQNIVNNGFLNRFPLLRNFLTNPQTNTWYRTGDIIRYPLLAATMRRLATGGATEFYCGSLADDMVREIRTAGGIINKQDFCSYYANVTEPLTIRLSGNLTVYSPPLPSSGVIFQYILNILSGYNMTSDDLSTNKKTILTYHRYLEAFKHAYAARSLLGSPYTESSEFQDRMNQIIANLTSPRQGKRIRRLILDNNTLPWQSYNTTFRVHSDQGTSQLCVLAANGDAVSVTSTINMYFGSKVLGATTGIVYNNMMDDFSTPGVNNVFGVGPSPTNFIQPGKRPMSSMTPSIVVNRDGLPVLITGSSGGPKITTTTALVTSFTLWMGKSIKSAIDAPVIHHQLLPHQAFITDNAPQWLIDGLRGKGHIVTVVPELSIPSGILQRNGRVFANSKNNSVDGY